MAVDLNNESANEIKHPAKRLHIINVNSSIHLVTALNFPIP